MQSQGLRLIAGLMLVAFLAANSIAIANPCLAASHDCCVEDADHPDDQADSSPSCPDHHDGPKPCCPCPGGCAYCSVAKVPWAVTPTLAPQAAVCVGQCLSEVSLLYLPPFHGTLIRPPRV
jgi:hypothetical protein